MSGTRRHRRWKSRGVCVVVRAKRDGKKKDSQGIEPWPQGVGLGSGCNVRDRSDEEDDT